MVDGSKNNMLPPPLRLINRTPYGLLATLWPRGHKGFTRMYAKDRCFDFLVLLLLLF